MRQRNKSILSHAIQSIHNGWILFLLILYERRNIISIVEFFVLIMTLDVELTVKPKKIRSILKLYFYNTLETGLQNTIEHHELKERYSNISFLILRKVCLSTET